MRPGNTSARILDTLYGEAVRFSAAALVLVHNHPSGDPEPSPEDLAATRDGRVGSQGLKGQAAARRSRPREQPSIQRSA